MKTTPIILPKDKYISQIEPFMSNGIDINSIYHKTVTGCGITHYAIKYFKQALIIILPNRPVIEDKVKEHNKDLPNQKILGVHKGIDVTDIKRYLNSDVEHKKILTTPEGFMKKVLKAFGSDVYTMFNDYFILFDECDRIITDVAYRAAIAAPLNMFFMFKKKAMVSATTLPFSDKRLKDFNQYVITPDYDYSKDIVVVNTNNVIGALKKRLAELDTKQVFIFLNSTNGISAVIKQLGIESESKIFCAQDSVSKLQVKEHKQASSYFDKDDLKKYNFLTSRYFSAFDIKITSKPDVIMVSDVFFADHSILDPHTEVIQIAGRLRNGVNSLTHIASFNPELKAKTKEESLNFLDGCFKVYDGFVLQYQNSTNPGSVAMLDAAVKESFAHSFYDDNGDLNSAMVDNYIYEQRVRGYYQRPEKLWAAYQEQALHFNASYVEDFYEITDEDFLSLHVRQTQKEKWFEVAKILEKLVGTSEGMVLGATDMRNRLVKDYPLIVDAHRYLGLDGLIKTGFVKSEIYKAVKGARQQREIIKLAPHVYNVFNENDTCFESLIDEKLTEIYSAHGVKEKVAASHIKRYFLAIRSQRSKVNVYNLYNKIDLSVTQEL